ncbi:MAG: YeeE/YedE family protein [Chloroflexi bacterium]|nr:YeeE/YedE family protein [Chloroflexota bacterium]
MLSLLKRKEWSPYLAGTMLGLVYVISIAVTGIIPGASGAFENIGGLIAQAVYPELTKNTYFQFVMPPGITTAVMILLGIVIGAFISAKLSGDFKLQAVSDPQWKRVFGTAVWKRWLVLFIGGIVLEIGAGIAGGCTSGLAIGGGLFLAPSAFIFIGAMFLSGIPTALIFYRRKY